jgi:hypothetical protein
MFMLTVLVGVVMGVLGLLKLGSLTAAPRTATRSPRRSTSPRT